MKKRGKTAKSATLLTAAISLSSVGAGISYGKSRCEADLGRVQKAFCLGDQNLEGATTPAALNYSWKLNDQSFDLSANACFSSGVVGARRDMVLALDRSWGVFSVDTTHHKLGANNIDTATYIISKLQDEAKANPANAPKIGIVMFSSSPDCRAYTGGDIAVDREFPCLYVPAHPVTDAAHVQNLLNFLKAADGKYSEGGVVTNNSDYTVLANVLAGDALGLNSPVQSGLMLFSDGRTYKGDPNDSAYAYLRVGNYLTAEDAATKAFAGLHKYKMVFALDPSYDPAISGIVADGYDNMCNSPGAAAADCTAAGVKFNDPTTWPVNKIDIKKFAVGLVATTGGTDKDVIPLTAKEDINPGLESLRITAASTAPIDAVSYSINGAAPINGVASGTRISLPGLPAGQALKLELTLTSNGSQMKLPISVGTQVVPDEKKDFSDAEMFCAAVAGATDKPTLANLQGGSASCGVTANSTSQSAAVLLAALLMPVAAALISMRRRPLVVAAIAVFGIVAASAAKADESQGLNVLQYRPVVDGTGNTEKATTLAPGTYNAGMFMSYANDALDLGGERNKRISPIMDNLVTAHVVADVGLLDRASFGLHVPYVHNSSEDRSVEGNEKHTGNLGRPADVDAMLKIAIVRKATFNFGLMPMMTAPTGDASLLIGDGSPSYGGMFLLSGSKDAFSWAFNTGYMHRSKPLVLGDDRAHSLEITGQFLNYGGIEYRYSPKVSFGGNVQGKFTSGEDIDFTRRNPAEWAALTKYRPLTGLELEGGVGTGIGKGYGSPNYRVFGGATFVPGATANSIPRRAVASK